MRNGDLICEQLLNNILFSKNLLNKKKMEQSGAQLGQAQVNLGVIFKVKTDVRVEVVV